MSEGATFMQQGPWFMRKRKPLTPAEIRERSAAGKASAEARHRAETSPSVKQGSTTPPSKQAVGLFRQGQARPDTRAKRGAWDTRGTEAPVGAMNASFTFHFPKAYREAQPDRPTIGPKSMAAALARAKAKDTRHQDVVITNPETLLEAHMHPRMREIAMAAINAVRDNQKGAIEHGHARRLIPEGTRIGTVARAYKHAALRALHKAGLGHYDTHMDEAAKAEFRPLVPFMRYASRRVFDHLNQGELKGKWQPFRDEFGVLYRQKKHGKLTGHERMRMKPIDQLIKLDLVDFDLEKAWAELLSPIPRAVSEIYQQNSGTLFKAFSPPKQGKNSVNSDGKSPFPQKTANQPGAKSALGGINTPSDKYADNSAQFGADNSAQLGAIPPAGPRWANFSHQAGFSAASENSDITPANPGASLAIGGAASFLQQVQQVEDQLGVPRIGGSTQKQQSGLYKVIPVRDREWIAVQPASNELVKNDMGFLLGYNTDPKRQLARAIHPRLRTNRPRLRLNTQRNLRHLLNGGVTRQERWQLGAPSGFGKMAKAVPLGLGIARKLGAGVLNAGSAVGRKIAASPRNKIAAAAAGGLAVGAGAPRVKQASGAHPEGRAAVGAAIGAGLTAIASRGHAGGLIRGASHKLYQTGLKDALRAHARVLAGGTASPEMKAAARQAFTAAKKHALHTAKQARTTGMQNIKLPRAKIAAGALAGGGLAAASGPHYTAAPLYQLAAQPASPPQ